MVEKKYIAVEAAYDMRTLEDWYINSVLQNDTPVWTEEHLAELFDDFYVIPKNTPTIDVAPVKHGHWAYNPNGLDWNLGAWECSLCHSVNNNLPCDERIIPTIFLGSTYCPNCGAKMDEQEGDEK